MSKTELPSSVDSEEYMMLGGAIIATTPSPESKIYTVISHENKIHGLELDEKGNLVKNGVHPETGRQTIAINRVPEGNDVWLIDEAAPDTVNRVRFLKDQGRVEFSHYNGIEPPPVAIFDRDGNLENDGTRLQEGLPVTIPQTIPAAMLEQATNMVEVLARGTHGSFSFSATKQFAMLPETLGIFTPVPLELSRR